MPTHNFARPRGRFIELSIESEALADNLLGDPSCRAVAVYLPEGYDADPARRYPVFVDLVGFTGSGFSHTNWKSYDESVPQRLDRLVAEGRMGPVIAVFPDCFTSLGGNQYIDSAAMGRWAHFLTRDLIERVDGELRTMAHRSHRAVFGKSSGGYGAIVHGMLYADTWGAVACHSGDMNFDIVYRPELPRTLDAIAAAGGSVEAYLAGIHQSPRLKSDDFHNLMILAMAATYDPDPDAYKGVRLPVDPHTCQLDVAAWSRWLAHDPLNIIETAGAQSGLRSLGALYVDCGSSDQYFLHYGSRAFVRRLVQLGIAHRYEEFNGTHSGVDYRMDESLPYLYGAVAEGSSG